MSDVLRTELAAQVDGWAVPKGFDPSAFQVSRGESLDNLPYQYLDCPRFYTRNDMFAFRVLIWWGRSLNCCWMLKGVTLPAILARLKGESSGMMPSLNVWCGPDPWQWERVTPLADVPPERLGEHGFLKLGTRLPLTEKTLTADGLQTTALAAFRALSPLLERA